MRLAAEPPRPWAARAARAAEILAELGLEGASVEAAGHDGAIAVIVLPAATRARLLDSDSGELVRRVQSLGFRYVAVDLAPAP